jgi:hypothetical protein
LACGRSHIIGNDHINQEGALLRPWSYIQLCHGLLDLIVAPDTLNKGTIWTTDENNCPHLIKTTAYNLIPIRNIFL